MYMAEVPAGPTVTDIDESTLPPGSEQTVGTDPTTVDVPAGGTGTDLDGYYIPTVPQPLLRLFHRQRHQQLAQHRLLLIRQRLVRQVLQRLRQHRVRPRHRPAHLPPSSPTAAPTPTPFGKVKGTVFEDVNNNGEQDPDEPPIEGVDVVITDSEGNVFTLTTDATGMYMAEVPIGETVIDIDESTLPPGYEQTVGTDPTTVDVPSGGTATDLDGYHFPTEMPTKAPTSAPTASPSGSPTGFPTTNPTDSPTASPTSSPTAAPTPTPSGGVEGNCV